MESKKESKRKRFFSIELFIGIILMGLLEQSDMYSKMTIINTMTFVIMILALIVSIDLESYIWDYICYNEKDFTFTKENNFQFWIILITEIIALISNFPIPLIRYTIIINIIILIFISIFKCYKESVM